MRPYILSGMHRGWGGMGIMVPQGARRPNKGGTREIGKVSPHLVWSTSIKGTGGIRSPHFGWNPIGGIGGPGYAGHIPPSLYGAQ